MRARKIRNRWPGCGTFAQRLNGSLAADEVVSRLPFADETEPVAAHQHLRRERARVVVRSHHETVGAGAHERREFAFVELRQLAILREEVAAFADRPDDVDRLHASATRGSRTGTISW